MSVSTKTTRTPPSGTCRHGQPLGQCADCSRTIRAIARAHQTLHARKNGKRHRVDSAHNGNGKPPKLFAPSVPAPAPEPAVVVGPPSSVRRCRVCACTEGNCSQCIARTGVACHWVEADLCSACVGIPSKLDAELLALGLHAGTAKYELARVVAMMPAYSFTREELILAAFKASAAFALEGFPQYPDSRRVHEAIYARGLLARGIVASDDGWLCKGPKCPVVEK